MKILVVGVNGFGKMHLSAIKDMEISIVERNKEVINDVMAKFDIKKVYDDYNTALKGHFDIVDLTVPHYLHKEMAIRAMENKNNVIIEKPIATTVEDAEEMIKASEKYGVKFMVSDQYFFDPSVRKAMELIKNNEIGNVNTVIVRDQRFFTHEGWRQTQKYMGGGSLIDGGIHFIDTLLNFGGEYSDIYSSSNHSGSIIEGEDNTSALFKFKNGITGLFFYSWSYANPPEVPAFEIIGKKGSIYEDCKSRTSWNVDDKIRTVYGDLIMNGKKMNIEKYDVYSKEIEEFKNSVENNTDVPFKPELALRDLKAVLTIYKNSLN